jgi:hypothetical protein
VRSRPAPLRIGGGDPRTSKLRELLRKAAHNHMMPMLPTAWHPIAASIPRRWVGDLGGRGAVGPGAGTGVPASIRSQNQKIRCVNWRVPGVRRKRPPARNASTPAPPASGWARKAAPARFSGSRGAARGSRVCMRNTSFLPVRDIHGLRLNLLIPAQRRAFTNARAGYW